MNRHERRRAAKRFAVAIEIVSENKIRRDGPLASTILAMKNSDKPPLCAACPNVLPPGEPPTGRWMLFRRLDTGARTLAAVCAACSQLERGDLIARAATVAGVTLRLVHPQWGRA